MKYIVKIEVAEGGKGVFIEDYPADAADALAEALISARPGARITVTVDVEK